jgi:hypothetical protein
MMPPWFLAEERLPFLKIRSMPGHEDNESDMFYYLTDRREWLVADEESAARIREFYPKARVVIDERLA